jgi:hypothetical protein
LLQTYAHCESGRGLPHSKTWRPFEWFMGINALIFYQTTRYFDGEKIAQSLEVINGT